MEKILVTGVAGFIGYHLAQHLMQKGDVYKTFPDTTKLRQYTGYQPIVSIREGIKHFFHDINLVT